MNDDRKSGCGVLVVVVVVFALINSAFKGCDSSTPTSNLPARQYDPNSTSEENRLLLRNQMIKQGTNPVEAEVFTRELYKAEREHRRKYGLPE